MLFRANTILYKQFPEALAGPALLLQRLGERLRRDHAALDQDLPQLFLGPLLHGTLPDLFR
jgi:hypothetical protein